MPILEGTDKSRLGAQRRLSEEQPKMTDKQKEYYQKRLADWKTFKASPMGDACVKLAEAKLVELRELLATPALDAVVTFRLPPSEINEIRAEIRGQYKVWNEILYEQDAIFEALARMQVEEATRQVKGSRLDVPTNTGKVIAP